MVCIVRHGKYETREIVERIEGFWGAASMECNFYSFLLCYT